MTTSPARFEDRWSGLAVKGVLRVMGVSGDWRIE
jgi:hypothetical protein